MKSNKNKSDRGIIYNIYKSINTNLKNKTYESVKKIFIYFD